MYSQSRPNCSASRAESACTPSRSVAWWPAATRGGAEGGLQPAAQPAVDDERLVPPEEPVMDDDELCAGGRRPLEELERAGDAAGDLAHVGGAGDLQPGHSELGAALDLEQLVREGDDLVPMGHEPRLYGRKVKVRQATRIQGTTLDCAVVLSGANNDEETIYCSRDDKVGSIVGST